MVDAGEQETEALDEIHKNSVHVLVVDDDRIMRMMIEERVAELGHKTSAAANGKDAYDLLIKEKRQY